MTTNPKDNHLLSLFIGTLFCAAALPLLLVLLVIVLLTGCAPLHKTTKLPPMPPGFGRFAATTEAESPAVVSAGPALNVFDWSNGILTVSPPGFTWLIPGTNRVTAIDFREFDCHMRIAPYYFHDRDVYGPGLVIVPGFAHGGEYVQVHPTTRTE
jgi:hypothetical protein